MTSCQNPDFAEWVTAVATFLAVVVALFREEIAALWRRPKLDAKIVLSAPDCEKTEIRRVAPPQLHLSGMKSEEVGTISVTGGIVSPTEPLWRGEAFFFRIWISNDGRLRATNVQVFAAGLKVRHADGGFRPVHTFLPMNLQWTHSHTPNTPEIFADINPSMGRHCNLGSISDPANRILPPMDGLDVGLVSFDLALEVLPNTQSHRLLPGNYRLELRIAGANSRPTKRTIEINFSGRWYAGVADMFRNGIGIKEV